MMWNIDTDGGDYLFGWLVAENRAREPVMVVVVDGLSRYRVPANFERPDIKKVGWHESGLCGFLINRDVCPEISEIKSLEVFEEDTNTLIYRRAPLQGNSLRIFHLETQTFPVYDFVANLAPFSQLAYNHVELIGEETLTSIIRIGWCKSVVVSGAIAYRRYSSSLRDLGYHRSVLLSHPVRELAGRLVQLQMLGARTGAGRTWKHLGQGALIEALAYVDLSDSASITRALKKLDDGTFFSLADPLTRKLVGQTLQDPVEDHHVAAALDTLAEFEVVGFDKDLARFTEHLDGLLGESAVSRQKLDDPPDFAQVMAAVASSRPVRELIRLDMMVFELAQTAASKAGLAGSVGALNWDQPLTG